MKDTRSLYAELTASAVRHETPCGTGRMVWREWGAGDETLVMLHGGSGSWRHWIRNIPVLAPRYRLLVADLPGLGDSDLPPQPFDPADLTGSVQHLASIVMDGINLLEPRPVRVIGFSAGSITGGHLAAMFPRRVLSLHLAGASGLGLPWGGLAGRLQAMTDDMNTAERLAAQAHNAGLIMLDAPVAPDSIEARLQLDNAELARLRSHPLADSAVLRAALAQIDVPIHAIWGGSDPYALPDLDGRMALIRRYFPGADVRVLAGAGHWVMYERADGYNPALLAQLQLS